MILFSFVIQHLLYTFLICYQFDITNGQGLSIDASSSVLPSPVEPLNTSKINITALAPVQKPDANTVIVSSNPIAYKPILNVSDDKINSTGTAQNSKSSVFIILASVFGGLAIIITIACIITYILIRQGYIKVFNQPRRQIYDGKQSRIVDSSSTVRDASPSRR